MQVQGEKAMEIKVADVAELVDARDLKSLDGNVVWVRVPPPAPRGSSRPVPENTVCRRIAAPERSRRRRMDKTAIKDATEPNAESRKLPP